MTIRGRSSGFRIDLLAAPSRFSAVAGLTALGGCVLRSKTRLIPTHQSPCGVRSRLQRRDRNGIAPFSLFFRTRRQAAPNTSCQGRESITALVGVKRPPRGADILVCRGSNNKDAIELLPDSYTKPQIAHTFSKIVPT